MTEDIDNACPAGLEASGCRGYKGARVREKIWSKLLQDIIQPIKLVCSVSRRSPWSPFGKLKTSLCLTDMTKRMNNYIHRAEEVVRDEEIDLFWMWPLDALSASFVAVAEACIPVSYPYVSSRKSLLYWTSGAYCDDSNIDFTESTPA